jgi:hypothetical protein
MTPTDPDIAAIRAAFDRLASLVPNANWRQEEFGLDYSDTGKILDRLAVRCIPPLPEGWLVASIVWRSTDNYRAKIISNDSWGSSNPSLSQHNAYGASIAEAVAAVIAKIPR